MQDEISNAIVTALKLKLLPQEKQAFERRGTDSAEAYDLYLMARSYYLAGDYGDPRRDEAIERLSRRAVEIDPGYAKAWALLASGQYSLRRNHGRPGDGGQLALDQALILDPDLAEARALKALMLSEACRHGEASAPAGRRDRGSAPGTDVRFIPECGPYRATPAAPTQYRAP